jgi:hypothetical protein
MTGYVSAQCPNFCNTKGNGRERGRSSSACGKAFMSSASLCAWISFFFRELLSDAPKVTYSDPTITQATCGIAPRCLGSRHIMTLQYNASSGAYVLSEWPRIFQSVPWFNGFLVCAEKIYPKAASQSQIFQLRPWSLTSIPSPSAASGPLNAMVRIQGLRSHRTAIAYRTY